MVVLYQRSQTEHRKSGTTAEDRDPLLELEENRDPLLDFEERCPPGENRDPLLELEENRDPLLDFEERCPPGGTDSVVLYTTGLRGIQMTFEDCNSIKFLLDSFRVLYSERDISMHSVFREELWMALGGKIVPPRLFIKGRYIGGAEVVLTLHEQGNLALRGCPGRLVQRPVQRIPVCGVFQLQWEP
ncbi:hypothetical protein RHSIM_Rhsim03G0094700 [Rhododendron simsii]|uniref:Glutaredoxin domain-containing protein n=1 Tax=Rhododendron simsii TaxID=118357 RepID=A0A834LUN1_RHOSS|nr:hypothetical protein RHSIM_Rhsim03G0094700 [Rhododendron simsii]